MGTRTTTGYTPAKCNDKASGTPTGYRHHMDRRKKWHPPLVWDDVCAACREAIRVHHAGYRNRRILNGARTAIRNKGMYYKLTGGELMVDATGTRRRLQALACMGWSWEFIGQRLGQNGTNIGFTAKKRKYVYPETAAKIRALYDELSMIPAPTTRETKVVITRARKKGWIPPLSWDDDMIDDPYALPQELPPYVLWAWFRNTANLTERMEWVLEYGFPSNPRIHRKK